MSPEETERLIARSGGDLSAHGPAMQRGTPYGVSVRPMMSPLGIPCNEPPYGTITAVDPQARAVAWQSPIGTVEDTGPLGFVTHLPIPIGMPTIGGTMTTRSGLVFFAGTQDFYLRALDARSGREVWKARLPVGFRIDADVVRVAGDGSAICRRFGGRNAPVAGPGRLRRRVRPPRALTASRTRAAPAELEAARSIVTARVPARQRRMCSHTDRRERRRERGATATAMWTEGSFGSAERRIRSGGYENGDLVTEIAASSLHVNVVAGVGFEPTTFGL